MSNNFWMGSDGVITPLHFDLANNFLALFAGIKQVTLYPPEDTELLDPMRDLESAENRGHVTSTQGRPFATRTGARPRGCR